MGRSFLAHTLLTSQNNEENQNMRVGGMKDEGMVLLLKEGGHDKKQIAQNQLQDEVFNFRYTSFVSLKKYISMICLLIVLYFALAVH